MLKELYEAYLATDDIATLLTMANIPFTTSNWRKEKGQRHNQPKGHTQGEQKRVLNSREGS